VRARWAAARLLFLLLLLPAPVLAAGPEPTSASAAEAALRRHPYDDSARAALAQQYRQEGSYADAYYHAAWLTWLSGSRYAANRSGAAILRDRDSRDRAARLDAPVLVPVISAVRAEQLLYDTCLNGAIAQHAGRLHKTIADMLAAAEESESGLTRSDPVARMALARLGLTLDDVLVFEDTAASRRLRPAVLRAAASRAEAVAAWLPDAPGPHRTLSLIRARLAELDNRSSLWDLAIAEALRARDLDPEDPSLPELLWTLDLRAGRWRDAAVWRSRVEASQDDM